MKIGILTYHFSENYGAVLQAYALQNWLLDMGHDVTFVNYHPTYVEEGGDFVPFFKKGSLRANTKVAYLKLSKLKRSFFGNAEQTRKFNEFRRQTLKVDGVRFVSLDQLKTGCITEYDMLIAGSDQIWNPSAQRGLDPAYFLAFGAERGTRRVSYAPSFGRDSLQREYAKLAGQLLQHLDAISVREESGIDIVQAAAGRPASCVPDPTLLLTNYSALTALSHDERAGHVFCYALRSGEGVRQVAEAASASLNVDILSPYNVHRRWREIGQTVYPGPVDWLRLIENSGFVVTNSFHGAVFAIIFRRPFLAVGLPGEKAGLNARTKNLLKQLGLEDRFVEPHAAEESVNLMRKGIDWQAVEAKQSDLRRTGEEFLRSELELVSVAQP